MQLSAEDDKAAILGVIRAETEAFLQRDIDALASYWVQSPDARRMVSVANLGTRVFEGWDDIKDNYVHLIAQFPDKQPMARMHLERMNIVVSGDVGWACYDQVGDIGKDNFEMGGTMHQLKIFQRIDGRWKMACLVVMQRSVEHATCPLIEIAADRSVVWMNVQAHEQINDYPAFAITGGRLRVLNRSHDSAFQEAVAWAATKVRTHWTQEPLSRLVRAVILGKGEDGTTLFCWLSVEDGKILVSFNDVRRVTLRIDTAQGIFGFTSTQAQLAALLVQGHDPTTAAEKLGVSVNTVRTHLQRLFDSTGVRTQSALVGLLLSLEAPIAK